MNQSTPYNKILVNPVRIHNCDFCSDIFHATLKHFSTFPTHNKIHSNSLNFKDCYVNLFIIYLSHPPLPIPTNNTCLRHFFVFPFIYSPTLFCKLFQRKIASALTCSACCNSVIFHVSGTSFVHVKS